MKKCTKCNKEKELSEYQKNGKILRPDCKDCNRIRCLNYSRTKEGVISKIYGQQRQHSKTRNHPLPTYTKLEFRTWILSQYKFNIIYDTWAASGYDFNLKPSVDRKKDSLPYTFDNIQLMTWIENRAKGAKEKRKKVIQMDLKGVFIKEHESMDSASKETNTPISSISQCCSDKMNASNNFLWKHKI